MEVRFGLFTFDDTTRELRCSGRSVHLSPKAFDLLALLLARRPHAVSRVDLHAVLWPETFVSDGSLAVLVAEIRRALGDSARRPSFVRTVNRFGYAFVEPHDASSTDTEQSETSTVCFLTWGSERVRLKQGDNVVGRDPDVGICLDAVGVSRRHAVITIRDGDVVVQDLASKNGTFVNGLRITSPTSLTDHAELRLGALRITLRLMPGVTPTQTIGESAGIGESR